MIRAVTVDAPAGEIWPWMMQMGAGRGGLYSYDWLENLAGLGIHSVDRIVPELQDLKEGDVFPLDARSSMGPTVAALLPERAIVLHFLDPRAGRSVLSWAYALEPIDEGTTRLIFRCQLDVSPRPLWSPGYALLVEIPHFVMERKMILRIKARAEKGNKGAHDDPDSAASDHHSPLITSSQRPKNSAKRARNGSSTGYGGSTGG